MTSTRATAELLKRVRNRIDQATASNGRDDGDQMQTKDIGLLRDVQLYLLHFTELADALPVVGASIGALRGNSRSELGRARLDMVRAASQRMTDDARRVIDTLPAVDPPYDWDEHIEHISQVGAATFCEKHREFAPCMECRQLDHDQARTCLQGGLRASLWYVPGGDMRGRKFYVRLIGGVRHYFHTRDQAEVSDYWQMNQDNVGEGTGD